MEDIKGKEAKTKDATASKLKRIVKCTNNIEHGIVMLEAELDSLKESYKATGDDIYSQRVLETKNALKILREYT